MPETEHAASTEARKIVPLGDRWIVAYWHYSDKVRDGGFWMYSRAWESEDEAMSFAINRAGPTHTFKLNAPEVDDA